MTNYQPFKPIKLNQIIIFIHVLSTRVFHHLGVDFVSYIIVLHHFGWILLIKILPFRVLSRDVCVCS